MTFESLRYEVKDRVAYVTFDTPARLNSISEQRLDDLEKVLDMIEAESELCAAVITGSGRGFCVGLDLDLLKKSFYDREYFMTVIGRLNCQILRMEALDVPFIAAVNGFARAGGFEIALACDLMIIADEAQIGDNHSHVGVMPGGGSTYRLPKRIGLQRAKELIWSARWLDGKEAVDIGLALKSVPLDQLHSETEKLLEGFRDKPAAVIRVVKKAIRENDALDGEEAIANEMAIFAHYMFEQPYAREGFEAAMADR